MRYGYVIGGRQTEQQAKRETWLCSKGRSKVKL